MLRKPTPPTRAQHVKSNADRELSRHLRRPLVGIVLVEGFIGFRV